MVSSGSNTKKSTSEILSKLKTGDVLKAKIIETSTERVVLKLADGTKLTAATLSTIDANLGDYIDFNVKSTENNKLILETAKDNVAGSKNLELEIKNILLKEGIQATDKNIEIAKELRYQEFPINKETIKNFLDILSNHKDVDIPKTAFLMSNTLETESQNINSLNQILEEKYKIGEKIGEIIEQIVQSNDENLFEKILSQSSTHLNNINKENILNEKEIITHITNEFNLMNLEDEDANITNAKNQLLNFIKENSDILGKKDTNIQNFIKENMPQLLKNNQNITEEVIIKIINNSKNNSKLYDNKNLTEKAELIKESLKESFVRINSSTKGESIDVKKQYEDIGEKLEVIKENIESSNIANKDEILAKIDILDNNLKFINQISNNNNNIYIQMPINMLNQDTTGEIYVLKKGGKNKKIDPEDSTLFLSINTKNIGQVDTLVKINKKTISVNLRVENEEFIKYMKQNYKKLYEMLGEIGYKLVDMKYRLISEDINFVNINKIINEEFLSNNRNFDYKI